MLRSVTGYFLRPRAERDLEEIWAYTARTWSLRQAEIYLREIQHSCDMIGDDTRLGRPCDDVRPGYRKFRSGSIFFFIGRSRTESTSSAFSMPAWISSSTYEGVEVARQLEVTGWRCELIAEVFGDNQIQA